MDNPDIKIVQVNVEDLIAADYNPRKWDTAAIAQLKESISKFGLIDPIIVNSATHRFNIILGGHFRLYCAKQIGYKTVPVVYIDVPTLEKEIEINLRLNKNSGAWDFNLLANIDQDLLHMVGFDQTDITKIFDLDEDVEDDFDLDDELEGNHTPVAKLGDVYQLGEHRLMCGDATNPDHLRELMGGVQADMVFTDPPYNVAYEGGGNYANTGTPKREMIKNDKMSSQEFAEFMDKSLKNMMDNCKGVFYVCMSSKELAALKDAFEKAGGHWQGFIIWVKNTFTLSRADWQNQYEPILYGWNDKVVNHYFAGFRNEGNVWENLEVFKPEFDGVTTTIKVGDHHVEIYGKVEGRICKKREVVDIWREKKPTKSTEHPTMKPVKLVAKAIRASSLRGGIVLDSFGGSGSTLIACEETGRICRTMELDPQYADVIIHRWEKLTQSKAVKLN